MVAESFRNVFFLTLFALSTALTLGVLAKASICFLTVLGGVRLYDERMKLSTPLRCNLDFLHLLKNGYGKKV